MPRYHAVVVSLITVATLAAAAGAQLTPFTTPPRATSFGTADFIGPLMAMGNTDGNSLSLIGDYNKPVAPGTSSDVSVGAHRFFTVGPLPIEVFDLTLTANAKWVNGGGPETLGPRTSWTITGGISEATSGIGVISTPSITGSQNGNGYTIIDETRTRSAPYVLSAGVQYTLYLSSDTNINTLDVPTDVPIPQMVVTHEFGKISNYRGYGISFGWRTVPTPGAATLATLSLALVARRRRA